MTQGLQDELFEFLDLYMAFMSLNIYINHMKKSLVYIDVCKHIQRVYPICYYEDLKLQNKNANIYKQYIL